MNADSSESVKYPTIPCQVIYTVVVVTVSYGRITSTDEPGLADRFLLFFPHLFLFIYFFC